MKPRILINCRASYQVLSDYLDGELAVADRMFLRGHLRMCAKCRDYLAQFRRIHELTGAPVPGELPRDFEELLKRVLERWRG